MTTTDPQEDTQALVSPPVDLVSGALVVAQGAIKPAEFDATNPFFKSKYATLGSVIAASREALCQSGLAILQVPTIQGDLVSVHTRIVHKSGQSLDCGVMSLSLGESDRNSDAQLAGSIITYLKRYAWSSILGIYADTDDDGNSGPKGAIPRQQPAKPPTLSSSAPATVSVDKARLKALHNLLGAPGEANEVMVHDFLVAKGWIKATQLNMDWPAEHVPLTAPAFMAIKDEIQSFHEQRAQSDLAEEMK